MIRYWLGDDTNEPVELGKGSYKKLIENLSTITNFSATDQVTVFKPLYNAAKKIPGQYELTEQVVEAIEIQDNNLEQLTPSNNSQITMAVPIDQDKQDDLNQIATDPFIALCQWLCETLAPVIVQVTPSAPPMLE